MWEGHFRSKRAKEIEGIAKGEVMGEQSHYRVEIRSSVKRQGHHMG